MHSSPLLIILSVVSLLAPLQARAQQMVLHKLAYSDSRCSFATAALHGGLNQYGKTLQNSFYYLDNPSCSDIFDGYLHGAYVNATIIDGTQLKFWKPKNWKYAIPLHSICDAYNSGKDDNSSGWYLEEDSFSIDPHSCFAHTGVDTGFYAFVLAPLDVVIGTPIFEYDPRVSLGVTFGVGQGRRAVTEESWQPYTPLTARNDLTEEFVKGELAYLRTELETLKDNTTSGNGNIIAIVAIALASVSIWASLGIAVNLCVMRPYTRIEDDSNPLIQKARYGPRTLHW